MQDPVGSFCREAGATPHPSAFGCHLLPQGEKGRLCYNAAMATAKKGQLVAATEWWKHLRWTKRAFWKRQRQAEKVEATLQRDER